MHGFKIDSTLAPPLLVLKLVHEEGRKSTGTFWLMDIQTLLTAQGK